MSTDQATDEWGQGGGEDDFAFDGGNYNKDDLGGDSVSKVGKYHFEITGVEKNLSTLNDKGKDQSPNILFTCAVLASERGGSPVGSKLFHRIYVAAKGGQPPKEGAVKSALRFGEGLGIIKEVEKDGRQVMVDAKTGLTKINAETFMQALGKQFCAEIQKEAGGQNERGQAYPDKFAIPFGRVYHPADAFVEDWPKDLEALKAIGIDAKNGGGGNGGGGEGGKKGGGDSKKKESAPPKKPEPEPEFDDDL